MSLYSRYLAEREARERAIESERAKYRYNPALIQKRLAEAVRILAVPEGRKVKKGQKATSLQAVEKAIPKGDPRKTLGTDIWNRYTSMVEDPRLAKYRPSEIMAAAGDIELGRRKEAIHRYIQKQHTGTFSTFIHKPYVPIPGQEEWERKHPLEIPHMRAEESALWGAGGAAVVEAGKRALKVGAKKSIPITMLGAAATAPLAFRVFEEVEPRVTEAIKSTSVGKEHPTVAHIGGFLAAAVASGGVPVRAIFGGGLSEGTKKYLGTLADKFSKRNTLAKEVTAKPTAENLMKYWDAYKEGIRAAEKGSEVLEKDKEKLVKNFVDLLDQRVKELGIKTEKPVESLEPLEALEPAIPLAGSVPRRRILSPEELESMRRGIHPGVPEGEGVIRYTPEELKRAGIEARKYKYSDIKSPEGMERILQELSKGRTKDEAIDLVGSMEKGVEKAEESGAIVPVTRKKLKKLGYEDVDIRNISPGLADRMVKAAERTKQIASGTKELEREIRPKAELSKVEREERLLNFAKGLSPQKREDLVRRGILPGKLYKAIVEKEKAKIEAGEEYKKYVLKEKEEDLGFLSTLGTEPKVLSKKEFVSKMLKSKGAKAAVATGIAGAVASREDSAEAAYIGTLGKLVGTPGKLKEPINTAFAKAIKMFVKGASAARDSEIFKETGWFKGPDGRWRFRIPDYDVKVRIPRPKEEIKLSYVYPHKKLYEIYPQLKNVTVTIKDSLPPGDALSYLNEGKIEIGDYYREANEFKALLAHEVQHFIQKIEGFAPGGNPFVEKFNIIKSAERELGRRPSPSELSEYVLSRYQTHNVERAAWERYRRLLGEVEARSVARESTLPPEVLKEMVPYETQLTPFTLINKRTGEIYGTFHSKETIEAFRRAHPEEHILATPTDYGITEEDLIIKAQEEAFQAKAFKPAKEEEAHKIADKLDIIYNGVQEDAKGKPAFHFFTDKKTGTTFATKSVDPLEVQETLDKKRLSFGMSLGLVGSITFGALTDFVSPRQAEAAGIPDAAMRVVTELVGKTLKDAKPVEVPKLLKAFKKMGSIPEPQVDPYTLPNPKESIRIVPDVNVIRDRAKQLPSLIQETMTPMARFWHYMGYKNGKELMSNPLVQWADAQGSALYNSTIAQKTALRILKDFIPGYKSSAKDLIKAMEPLVERYHGPMQERSFHFGMYKYFEKLSKDEWRKLSRKKKFSKKVEDEALATLEALEDKANRHKAAYLASEPLVQNYQKDWLKIIEPLAKDKRHAGIRVFLAAEDTHDFKFYPWLKGTLSFDEKAAVGKIKDMMETYGVRVIEAGEKVITSRPFMHHPWHPKMDSKKVLEELNKKYPYTTASPPMTRLYSRSIGYLPMVPDAEYSLTAYFRDINMRLEAMNFWREGKPDGWWAFKTKIMNEPGLAPKGLIDAFRSFEDGFKPYDRSSLNKWLERIYAFEVARLLAFSLSVPFKHALKTVATARIFGIKETAKAVPKAAISASKIAIKQAGGEEWLKKRGWGLDVMDEAVEAFTETGKLYRIISDISPFRVNEAYGDKLLMRFNSIGGAPLVASERFDRALTVICATKMAAKKGMTPAQALYSVYDTILKTNFLSGPTNPSWLRNPFVRLMLMFQGTPYKIMEQRAMMYKRGGEALLETVKQLSRDVIKGEQIFKWEMVKQGLNKEQDLFGTPLTTQMMRELMLIGTAVGLGKWLFDVDLLHHFIHVPFGEARRRDIAIGMPPVVNAALGTYNQYMQEDYDEFIVSTFFKQWFQATIAGIPAPVPVAFKKAVRLSEDDIPERYRDSRLKYLFAIPATHD